MKLICCLSNAPIKLNGFDCINKPLESVKTYHPIFNIKAHDLIVYKNKLEENEKPLFLLALLNNYKNLFILNHCDYQAISKDTIALIPTLLKQLDTYDNLACMNKIKIPKFKITTESINNLKNYLYTLKESLIEYNQSEALAQLRKQEASRESARKKVIRANTKGFSTKLTKWTIEQLGLYSNDIVITGANRKDKRGREYTLLSDYWFDMLKDITDLASNVFLYNRKDLDELYDYVLDNIPNDSDNSLMLYKILNTATKEYESLNLNVLSLEGSVEQENTNNTNYEVIKNWRNKPKPLRESYKSNMEFLIDKAKWQVANSAEISQDSKQEQEPKPKQANQTNSYLNLL